MSKAEKIGALESPCKSCPYRQDVPSGVWDSSEYVKLPHYDEETYSQPFGLFMCHQQNGALCSGWLACHGTQDTLAIRLAGSAGTLDPAVFEYGTDVPVFSSGLEAALHGLEGVEQPSAEARRMAETLRRIAARRGSGE